MENHKKNKRNLVLQRRRNNDFSFRIGDNRFNHLAARFVDDFDYLVSGRPVDTDQSLVEQTSEKSAEERAKNGSPEERVIVVGESSWSPTGNQCEWLCRSPPWDSKY